MNFYLKIMKKNLKGKKEIKPVNLKNEKELMSLGLRSKSVSPRDPNIWTKSKQEKKAIKKAKHSYKNAHPFEDWHIGNCPDPYYPYQCKLIIYLKKNKVFDKTTYSIICNPNDIQNYLNTYVDKKGNSCVKKYKYNGKEYSVEEKPVYML